MRYFLLILLVVATRGMTASAQTAPGNGGAAGTVSGTVSDAESGERLAGVSVVLLNGEGKMRKFVSTDKEGSFSMKAEISKGYRLKVSRLDYATDTVELDGARMPLRIKMKAAELMLKEVKIKDMAIREQGDTIQYNVSSFARQQDKSIGDVLKRMPGIEVDSRGGIKYQGEDINKFYIEGSDMLGGRYGEATKGVSHDDVSKVEVMENHQPLQVLSGIAFSDKAAINLKLKKRAKASVSGHAEAGAGYSEQPGGVLWAGEVFGMAVWPQFQAMLSASSNNTGVDLQDRVFDLFGNGRGTGIKQYVKVGLPGGTSIGKRHTMFNRSFLVSAHVLKKTGKGELKSTIDYAFTRQRGESRSITTYFLPEGNRVITEDRDGTEHDHLLHGKVTYELNEKKSYITNTLKTELEWDDVTMSMTGSLPNTQTAKTPEYYVSNDFKLIQRFKGKHLITIQSRNAWESLPQTLGVSMEELIMNQRVSDHVFHTDESVSYAFTVRGVTVGLDGGVSGRWRSMSSELPELPAEIPGLTMNVLNTSNVNVHVTPTLEYWLKKVTFSLKLPMSVHRYTFDKALANRTEFYFSPTLSMNWKPNNRFQMNVRAGAKRSPMSLSMIHAGFIMTDYRNFSQGTDDFYNTSGQNVGASFSYKHTRKGVFADGGVSYSRGHQPYMSTQQMFGDYTAYSYTDADNNSSTFNANGEVSKLIDIINGTAGISGGYRRGSTTLLSENTEVHSVSTSWNAGAKISASVRGCLNMDYNLDYSESRLAMNGNGASWLSTLTNTLSVTYTPSAKWDITVNGNHYRNEINDNIFKNTVMLGANVTYRLNKHLELGLSVSNLLDKREYSYTTYNELSSFESQRRLRGREVLLKIRIRK